ncbi:hypothetical protein J2X06_000095 [Lysobacter niastensis]|uniref:UrcA family protein n=1 Tax=Lysobacter niastensis TaxID=380629 RepID=A0ABU1W5Q1_9GAMM|nr:hypothetical protein [Lysobacter niastensis]MDR7132911.1 hypothetical protein [Lysobacter niastensis]
MNARISLIALAALLPAAALASPPHQATVYVDCNHLQMPSQQEVAGLTGADNFSQAYDRRTRLMVEVQRLCEQRGGQFQLVIEPSPDQDSDRIAKR